MPSFKSHLSPSSPLPIYLVTILCHSSSSLYFLKTKYHSQTTSPLLNYVVPRRFARSDCQSPEHQLNHKNKLKIIDLQFRNSINNHITITDSTTKSVFDEPRPHLHQRPLGPIDLDTQLCHRSRPCHHRAQSSALPPVLSSQQWTVFISFPSPRHKPWQPPSLALDFHQATTAAALLAEPRPDLQISYSPLLRRQPSNDGHHLQSFQSTPPASISVSLCVSRSVWHLFPLSNYYYSFLYMLLP